MAISTYAELQSAAANWLADTSLTSRIVEFIALGEAEIMRILRVREMETSADLTINAQSIALPTGYVAARRIYITTSPPAFLDYWAPESFWSDSIASESGQPSAYTIEGDNFIFGPTPDTTYTGKCLYWKRLDISSSAHSLFTRNPDLYLYATLKQAEMFLVNDERVGLWSAGFDRALAQIMKADIKDRHSGGSLKARSDTLGY